MLLINDNRDSIYLGIELERKLQDEKWGGPEHDDTHSVFEWVAIIQYFLGKAIKPVLYPVCKKETSLVLFRSGMLKVAALAVAAIESVDRKLK